MPSEEGFARRSSAEVNVSRKKPWVAGSGVGRAGRHPSCTGAVDGHFREGGQHPVRSGGAPDAIHGCGLRPSCFRSRGSWGARRGSTEAGFPG